MSIDEGLKLGGLIFTVILGVGAAWNARVAKKNTQPNGGSSMADAVRRIEDKQDAADKKNDRRHKQNLKNFRDMNGRLDKGEEHFTRLDEALQQSGVTSDKGDK